MLNQEDLENALKKVGAIAMPSQITPEAMAPAKLSVLSMKADEVFDDATREMIVKGMKLSLDIFAISFGYTPDER